MEPTQVVAAAGLNAVVAAAAFYKDAVTLSGALVGFVTGSVIYVAGAGYWAVLILFFLSSTLFGRLRPSKRTDTERVQAKGGRRDGWQVLANVAPAAIAAIVFIHTGATSAIRVYAAVMAAATADTWSSEIGVLSNTPPVSILTLKPSLPGLSGAISTLGLVAGGAGALVASGFTALTALATGTPTTEALVVFLIGLGLGVAGTLIDSLLGAAAQVQYRTSDGMLTERPNDPAGVAHTIARGLPWVTNDVVNFVTTSSVALAALLISLF
ncbi:MAG: DUF92 domain-containing protein [Spirochaetales bacterium]